MSEVKAKRNRVPGVLWLLPIFFGVLGGIIAAFVASLKYHASWWELFLAGFLISVVGTIIYFVFIFSIFSV